MHFKCYCCIGNLCVDTSYHGWYIWMAITMTAIRNHKIVFFKVLGKMGTNFLWLGKDKSLNFLKSLPRGVKMFGGNVL